MELAFGSHSGHQKVGTSVVTKKFGRCILASVKRKPDMNRFYSFCMSTSLEEIRCRRLWHVALAFHLYVHASTSSESLAESIASFLQTLKRRNLNEKLSTKSLVWAAQLKSLGLKGMGDEEGILSMALNEHFSCKDPSGWHFVAPRSRKSASGDTQRIQRDVRGQRQAEWISTPLFDLLQKGQMKLSKPLPRPHEGVMISREHANLPVTKKRKLVQEVADKRYDPYYLPQRLWSKVGVSTSSLPSYLRPSL